MNTNPMTLPNNQSRLSQYQPNNIQYHNLYDARSIKSDQMFNSHVSNSNASRISYINSNGNVNNLNYANNSNNWNIVRSGFDNVRR